MDHLLRENGMQQAYNTSFVAAPTGQAGVVWILKKYGVQLIFLG
jgi:hypothetical protein